MHQNLTGLHADNDKLETYSINGNIFCYYTTKTSTLKDMILACPLGYKTRICMLKEVCPLNMRNNLASQQTEIRW